MKSIRLFLSLLAIISLLVACGVSSNIFVAVDKPSWVSNPTQQMSANDDFQEFVSNFPKVRFPLKIDKPTIEFFRDSSVPESENTDKPTWKRSLISKKYSSFIPSLEEDRFSRIPTQNVSQYVAYLGGNDRFVAVMYSSAVYYGDYGYMEGSPIRFLVATYTPTGRIIDEKEVAYDYNNSAEFASAIIDKNLKIKVSLSEIKDEKAESKEVAYQISKTGRIEDIAEQKIKNKETKNRTDYIF